MSQYDKMFDSVFQCAAIGASFCYLLSLMAGRPIVDKYFPERAASWKLTVSC